MRWTPARWVLATLLLSGAACDAGAQPAAPPPAPMLTTSRDDIVRMLRGAHPERCMPFTVAMAEPRAIIRVEDGEWVLRGLTLDRAAADREEQRRRAAGEPWMPEHLRAFLRPGPVRARGGSAPELARAIEQITDWESLRLGIVRSPAPRDLCPASG